MTHRKLLQSKAIAIENDLRGTLRNFGLKVGTVGQVKFEARIQELVETFPELAALVEPLLMVRRALREQIVILHRRLLSIVRDDEMCRHMARERASRLAGRRRDRVTLALVAEMQERHEHNREGGEGRR
jgi:transposase